jgi:hypothetical protein
MIKLSTSGMSIDFSRGLASTEDFKGLDRARFKDGLIISDENRIVIIGC